MMTRPNVFSFVLWIGVLAMLTVGCADQAKRGVDLGYDVSDRPALTETEVASILDRAERAADEEPSLLRRTDDGDQATTRMHIVVVDRHGTMIGRRSMDDAWAGSVDIAGAKAFTAMAFSSDQNALTTRTIGQLSQPGGPLWQIGNSNPGAGIIEFPGGLPLYKDDQLVGAIGVSGDGVDQDENVAEAGAGAFMPPEPIRVDTVTGGDVSYVK